MSANYEAPLDDMRFVLNEVLEISKELGKFEAYKDVADIGTINDTLDMVADIAEEVLQPLNATGDQEGCTYDLATRSVKTPDGFKKAYKDIVDAGITALACAPEYGGFGMPLAFNTALSEILSSANLSFGLYPGLSHGVYTALEAVASQEQKDKYLPKIVSGEWTGTMCLTEPGAGTDLGQIITSAEEQPDGSYKLTGEKIFISAGDHDLLDKDGNIIHFVLARIKGAEAGVRGLSVFVVQKFNDDGSRNPVYPTGLEEKMGLHGNATCKMSFEGATGQLVGKAGDGIKNMFIMMNEERLGVGVQGNAQSEVAYQKAVEYALGRLQGQPITQSPKDQTRTTIINHGDVRNELLNIKSTTEGGRMLAYWTAMQLDIANNTPDTAAAKKAQDLVELLTPIVKAHLTDNAEINTSRAMQIYGGHGYITENGVEQFSRDARITRLYEGTNGIQALDLLGRKAGLMLGYLEQLQGDLASAKKNGVAEEFTKPVEDAVQQLMAVSGRLLTKTGDDLKLTVGAVATDFLKLTSLVTMGHMWVKMVDTAQQRINEGAKQKDFYETKIQTGRFYMEKIMPQSVALAATIDKGANSILAISNGNFAHSKKKGIGTKERPAKPANTNQPPAATPNVA